MPCSRSWRRSAADASRFALVAQVPAGTTAEHRRLARARPGRSAGATDDRRHRHGLGSAGPEDVDIARESAEPARGRVPPDGTRAAPTVVRRHHGRMTDPADPAGRRPRCRRDRTCTTPRAPSWPAQAGWTRRTSPAGRTRIRSRRWRWIASTAGCFSHGHHDRAGRVRDRHRGRAGRGGPVTATSPAVRLRTSAQDALVETLRDLIRIPSINPPSTDRPGRRTRGGTLPRRRPDGGRARARGHRGGPGPRLGPRPAARRRDRRRAAAAPVAPRRGARPTRALEPRAVRRGRGGRVRLRPRRRRHEEPGGDGAGGRPPARGGGVRRRPRSRSRSGPRPPPRRPVHLYGRRGGGRPGGGGVDRRERPEWLAAAGAINECGAVSTTVAGVRFYPIQVAEKGYAAYRIHVHGTWGHGSMPREDNAVVLAAAVIAAAGRPGADPAHAGHGAASSRWPREPCRPAAARIADAALAGDDPAGRGRAATACATDGMRAPSARCCATRSARMSSMPGSSTTSSRATPRSRWTAASCPARPSRRCASLSADRPGAGRRCKIELMVCGHRWSLPPRVSCTTSSPATIRDHDPDGIPLPFMAPSPRTPSTPPLRRRPTASRRCGSSRMSGCSSASTAWMNGSRSTALRWGLPSCTTWCAASAVEEGRSAGLALRVRRRLDEDLLTAAVQT